MVVVMSSGRDPKLVWVTTVDVGVGFREVITAGSWRDRGGRAKGGGSSSDVVDSVAVVVAVGRGDDSRYVLCEIRV